ncbi:AAA ATPase [Shewanella halifaxensis HAW-EB4]|uniref:AAA ATPase n=1 Tax=Shewanella halifaxensis (strain HAW-EB4) TaxID=458817 RepID=B0TM52_SHEHH|nr:AAA family ATPase [Shewanella halifaxensis]ABZ74645.1 AAA ATPase [Shewanella halifaxensis HAW-EB4]
MTGYIQNINTKIPFTDKVVNIELQGKSLILTGGNGCGKTNFLNHLLEYLTERVINRKNADPLDLHRRINSLSQSMAQYGASHESYEGWKRALEIANDKLFELENPILSLSNLDNYVVNYQSDKALLTMFKAVREAKIAESTSALSTSNLADQVTNKRRGSSAGSLFEQYLVSYKTVQAYAESPSIDNDPALASKVKSWFEFLQDNLRYLFEDETLKLRFDSKLQTFFIQQEHKEEFRFQKLSSGFSSILAVYADLVTTIQLTEITPDEIEGVVFIDEIDAHLHVSLQRKIFAFLTKSFPKIQFIVTTHSPFVVSSVSDAVIYDLSKLEQIDDLSMYSYESILDGLFGVSSSSDLLNAKVKELNEEATKLQLDIGKVESLISELRQSESKLDSESLYFLESAQLSVLKAKAKSTDV